MSKNPVIKRAHDEGYNLGFINGTEFAKKAACEYFASRFEGLQDVKGIGPKTMDIIVKHFGKEYFKKIEDVK